MLYMDIKLFTTKRMADTEVQTCLDWLLDQKGVMEQSNFGSNRQSVTECMERHSQHRKQLQEYNKHIEKLKIKQTLTEDELHSLFATYQTVQTLEEKKTSCFEVMNDLATLDDQIQGLCTKFDNKAVHLTNLTINNRNKQQRNGLNNESMATAAKNCIIGMRDSWRWMDELMQCAHVHLANAAAYHEFFHDVDEVDYWMDNTMSNMHKTFSRKNLDGDRTHLASINKEMKDTLLAYLRWQSEVDSLYTRARDIVPVHRRISPIKAPCPVLALTSYKTNEIEFTEGDTLTLLDNSDEATWKVKNESDQIATVPAAILLINGPSGEAIDAALRLKMQLLSLWGTSTKRLGYQMIDFMQLIFSDSTPESVKAIQNMPTSKRDELLTLLTATATTFRKNCDGYEGSEDLQGRIARLRTMLEEANVANTTYDETSGQVIFQVRQLQDLLNHYQEFWTYWDSYKEVAEILRHRKLIVVCDKWDELKYKSTAHFIRFWDTSLVMPADGGKHYKAEAALTLYETPKTPLDKPASTDSIQSEVLNEVMTAISADTTDSTVSDAISKLKTSGKGADGDWSSSDTTQQEVVEEEEGWSSTEVTEHRRHQEVTSDEVVCSTEEVRHTYEIKRVVDPRTDEYISLTDAVYAEIIDQVQGRYVNIVTGTSMSTQEAMAEGKLIVEFKTQQKIREENTSYGIITVKTTTETRPYTILGAIDPNTEEEVSTEVAYSRGILSKTRPTYRTETGDHISVVDAIYSGLVKAEFHGDEEDSDIDETKTYAINAVVDQRRKQKVSFHEALQNGLLVGEEGVYVHNVTKERIPITDAIMKGFLKAKIITDASRLDIDPTNAIVVRRLSMAKEKILKAVRVTRAFRSNVPAMNGN